MTTAELIIRPDGTTVGIYSDTIDYKMLGRPQIRRASHVEPTDDGRWTADLSPVDGPVLGPFDRRDEALAGEMEYLETIMVDPAFDGTIS